MNKKLFVGNLNWGIRDEQLHQLFEEFGALVKAEVVMDKFDPNKSRGFGFVEYETEEAAQAAVEAMNGKEVEGRALTVNEAREGQV